jgi:hypothetical protein
VLTVFHSSWFVFPFSLIIQSSIYFYPFFPGKHESPCSVCSCQFVPIQLQLLRHLANFHKSCFERYDTRVHIMHEIFNLLQSPIKESGKRSQYSDWLWAGRQRDRSLNPGSFKNVLFSTSSRLVLGPTQPSGATGGSFPRDEAVEA